MKATHIGAIQQVTKTINSVDNKEISVRDAKRDLLRLAATINSTTGNAVEGLANLLTKLPRLPLLDMADQDSQICLRWSNKSINDDITDMRPDAIISTLIQHEFGCPVGFGETKNGNASKQAVNLDVFRLGVASKRTLDLHDLSACLAFMVKGYHISFFIVSNHKDTPFYTMMEIAAVNFASSISDLHTFVSRKNLDLLAGVSNCFWTTCTDDLTMNTQTNALDDIVPIGDYLSFMAKSSKGKLGHSYRY
ncbi:hypothetical protein G6F50_008091 [Rhizopus delemar]|uniref:Uncharacterized protein n=1 Tax=Rhizopus delemar TaxID=936053 RepID=A0A9P7CLT7_9FUNG|nr:hypothetical protein G6F50_008091 [Rhizopus delemar]